MMYQAIIVDDDGPEYRKVADLGPVTDRYQAAERALESGFTQFDRRDIRIEFRGTGNGRRLLVPITTAAERIRRTAVDATHMRHLAIAHPLLESYDSKEVRFTDGSRLYIRPCVGCGHPEAARDSGYCRTCEIAQDW